MQINVFLKDVILMDFTKVWVGVIFEGVGVSRSFFLGGRIKQWLT